MITYTLKTPEDRRKVNAMVALMPVGTKVTFDIPPREQKQAAPYPDTAPKDYAPKAEPWEKAA